MRIPVANKMASSLFRPISSGIVVGGVPLLLQVAMIAAVLAAAGSLALRTGSSGNGAVVRRQFTPEIVAENNNNNVDDDDDDDNDSAVAESTSSRSTDADRIILGGGAGGRPRLNHMAIDPSTGSIYVGAVNRLYQLDADGASVVGRRSLGPRLDDRRCTEWSPGGAAAGVVDRCGAGGSTSYPARPTDNAVRLLAVDAARRRLVVCGSTFQGTCELLDLDIGGVRGAGDGGDDEAASGTDLVGSSGPTNDGNTDYFVAANDPDLSTVGFVAPGPGGPTVLYVAASYSGTTSVQTSMSSSSTGGSGGASGSATSGSGSSLSASSSSSSSSSSSAAAAAAAVSAVRQAVPAVSSRSLVAGPGAFRFVHVDGLTGGTAVRFRSEAIERFPVEYVSGFDGGDGFSYFVAVQPESFELSGSGVLPPVVSSEFGSRIMQVGDSTRYVIAF